MYAEYNLYKSIGTNLYLAKIALDITAKHCKDHIGMLDEQTFKETLWEHRPITDFWNIANGIPTFGISQTVLPQGSPDMEFMI